MIVRESSSFALKIKDCGATVERLSYKSASMIYICSARLTLFLPSKVTPYLMCSHKITFSDPHASECLDDA